MLGVSFSQAARSEFLLFLVSTPWWMILVQGLVYTSWREGLVPVHWWVELGLGPLVGRAVSRGMSRGTYSLLGEARSWR